MIAVLLLVLAATADSFLIGFNYGVKRVCINTASNLMISGICFAGTYAALLLGRWIGILAGRGWTDFLGGSVLLAFGGYMLVSAIFRDSGNKSSLENPEKVDKDKSNTIEVRESFLIGLLLSLNNLGIGIGGGMVGLPVLVTAFVCACASFVLLCCGAWTGYRLPVCKISKKLEILSALFVVVLGIAELLHAFL